MKWIAVFIIQVVPVFFIYGQSVPANGSIEGSVARFNYESDCKTLTGNQTSISGDITFVPGKTMITFYGDSRLDFADVYGKDMMYYLNEASNVNDTGHSILLKQKAEEEEKLRLAEEERQRQIAEAERLEAERQALLAQQAAAALAEAQAQAEAERLKAERLKQEEEMRNLLIACIFFGYCRR